MSSNHDQYRSYDIASGAIQADDAVCSMDPIWRGHTPLNKREAQISESGGLDAFIRARYEDELGKSGDKAKAANRALTTFNLVDFYVSRAVALHSIINDEEGWRGIDAVMPVIAQVELAKTCIWYGSADFDEAFEARIIHLVNPVKGFDKITAKANVSRWLMDSVRYHQDQVFKLRGADTMNEMVSIGTDAAADMGLVAA